MELEFDYEGCAVTVELQSKGFIVLLVETDDADGNLIELDAEIFQAEHGEDLEDAVRAAALKQYERQEALA